MQNTTVAYKWFNTLVVFCQFSLVYVLPIWVPATCSLSLQGYQIVLCHPCSISHYILWHRSDSSNQLSAFTITHHVATIIFVSSHKDHAKSYTQNYNSSCCNDLNELIKLTPSCRSFYCMPPCIIQCVINTFYLGAQRQITKPIHTAGYFNFIKPKVINQKCNQ